MRLYLFTKPINYTKKRNLFGLRCMIKGEALYSGSNSFGLILYSKKEGIGYFLPFGDADEGSVVFLSINGCFPDNGTVGFPPPPGGFTVVAKLGIFIFCIRSNCNSTIYQLLRALSAGIYYEKNIPENIPYC